jgi:cytochrome c553
MRRLNIRDQSAAVHASATTVRRRRMSPCLQALLTIYEPDPILLFSLIFHRAGLFADAKKGCGLDKQWLARCSVIDETIPAKIQRASAGKPHNRKLTMKKILLLAAMFGLAATLTTRGAEAKENWNTLCAKCHGAEGKGDTKMGAKLGCKDMSDAKVQAEIKDDAAFKAIKEGLKSADDKTLMKPFEQLSDDEIKALVAYVRGLKK